MKSDMGHRKWLDEYPSLKQVDENQPFTVPPGYFNELENKITSAIKLEELKSEKGFTVPKNYFDELTNNIQSRINIEEFNTGKEFTTPANYFDELNGNVQSRVNIDEFDTGKGLTVPANYFDELTAKIQSRINIEGYVNNDGEGHAIPPGYFEELQEQINARIFVEETLNAGEDFAVPAGYFDKLNAAIVNKTITQDEINRRGVVRKMFANSAFKYAAAACFALVIGTGILVSQLTAPPTEEHSKTFLHKQLSTVSTGDIQTYLQDDVDAGETQHAVIDETTPDNDANLNSALQSISTQN